MHVGAVIAIEKTLKPAVKKLRGTLHRKAGQFRGIAQQMCTHSLEHAKARGYRAMQFNFVVSTNERAVRLWQSLGFEIVGRLPGAFRHPAHGFVDALVMFRRL